METTTYPLSVVKAMDGMTGHQKHFFCESSDRAAGLTFKSEFELEICEQQITFRLYTRKRDGFIQSYLTGMRRSPSGSMVHVINFGDHGDFSRQVLREANSRATKSLLLSRHVAAIEVACALQALMRAHYQNFLADKAMSKVMAFV
jgi:hypothetical protein